MYLELVIIIKTCTSIPGQMSLVVAYFVLQPRLDLTEDFRIPGTDLFRALGPGLTEDSRTTDFLTGVVCTRFNQKTVYRYENIQQIG